MTDELTPMQETAAWHGLATNLAVPAADRLAAALRALDGYEAEVERLPGLAVSCSCASGPNLEGPQAECPVHGAVAAFNQAAAERDAALAAIERVRAYIAKLVPPGLVQTTLLAALRPTPHGHLQRTLGPEAEPTTKPASELQVAPVPLTAEEWNARYPVGTPVEAWPLVRTGVGFTTKTRSVAWALGHGVPVVLVDGLSGGIALTRVKPITDAAVASHA